MNGAEREIFMSYGLLNVLTTVVDDITNVALIKLDAKMRNAVLVECLAERKPSGKVKTAVKDIDDVEISIEHVELILGWVQVHVLDFLLRSAKDSVDLMDEHKETLEALGSSLDGAPNSPGKTA